MKFQVNGIAREVAGATTLADVVTHFKLDAKIIVIEHNLTIVPREHYANTPVAEGDKIEIVHFVGGGC